MEWPYSTNEAAIHRLVDDILAYIFELNATDHATTVASSQVCMRWRSIALHYHAIWGSIIRYSRHSLKWIETLLNRSHPSPLDFGSRINFVILVGRSDAEGVLELVFNYIDRLRVFSLRVEESSWEFVCSRFFQLPAPNLEFVNIALPYTDIRQLCPGPLFDHHAPNLRNLQLRRCAVDFTSPILTLLTELYVKDISNSDGSAVPTVLDWLNILGGMPSLRWLTLIDAISSATTNITYPIIHLAALDMLSVDGAFHESVALVEHLIAPPRCGLRLHCDDAQVGVDQRKLWAIIEKKMDSWAKNTPNRCLKAQGTEHMVGIGNIIGAGYSCSVWSTEARALYFEEHIHLLDPAMTIWLDLSTPQDAVPFFLSLFALFERTFFDTTYLDLRFEYENDDVFLPLVNSFRNFVNLEEMCLRYSLPNFLLPLLQHSLPNSVLLPALHSFRFGFAKFWHTSDTLLRVTDFLRWRREQGFPVQKINIFDSWIDRQYLPIHIQGTVVEIGDGNYYSHSFNFEDNN